MNICIVLNKPVVYSETFIKAHVDHLKGHVYYTTDLPYISPRVFKAKSVAAKLAFIAKKTYRDVRNSVQRQKLFSFWKAHKIDLVLAEYGGVGVNILPFCKEKKLPLVVHFHGYDAYRKAFVEKYLDAYRELFDYASAIIAVSRDMQEQLIRLGAPAEKVFYSVYGVDLRRFKPANVIQSSKQLLAVGRFVEKKAPYLTILAFLKVLDTVPDAKLIFAGEGILFDVCQKIVCSLNLSDSVKFYGSVGHEQIAELMQNSRAFVQHSIVPASGDSEGTPNTILEAQASALPIISTRHAGIKDVVVHGKTGYLVDEGDIAAMTQYMVHLLQHPDEAATLGRAGRDQMEANYSLESRMEYLKGILQSCVIH